MSLTKMPDQSNPVGNECSMYQAIAASQTTVNIGNKSTGSVGDYIESITVIPASSGATTLVLLDGSTAVMSIPTNAGTGTGTACPQPYTIQLGMRATTRWVVTTGALISCVVIGSWK